MKKTFHSRKFLNKSAGMAAIESNGSYTDYSFDCTIAISDCNRRIDLDMYMWDEKSIKEKLYKLNLLISELVDFRDWINGVTPNYLEGKSTKKKSKLKVTEVTLDDI
jgi:hypothetical protein